MAAPITQTIKLRDIVWSYSEASKRSEAEFLRLWRICFRGFKWFGLNATWEPDTIKITVNDNKTATLPVNCINWIKVGQLNGKNEFQTFARNTSLTTYRDNGPNRIADLTPEITSALLGPTWFGTYGFYGSSGAYDANPNFGAGSHLLQPGEFDVDMKNRVIILPQTYQYPDVYLMFLGAPLQNSEYEIPMQFEEAMIAWLAFEDIVNLPANGHVGNNTISMRGRIFASKLRHAKKMYKPFNIAEAEQYYRQSFLYGVKA